MAKKTKSKGSKSGVKVRDIKARKDVRGGHKRTQAGVHFKYNLK